MTTTFTETNAGGLNADLADISTGADAATNTDYLFKLSDNIALSSASLSLKAGSTLTLEGPGSAFIDNFAVTGTLIDETPFTGTISLTGGTLVTSLVTDTGGTLSGGTITGSVLGFSAGGDTVTNDGAITDTDAGSSGVDLSAGIVTNGSATNTAALISGASYGVTISNTGTVTNDGTLSGGTTGVSLAGGSVSNAATASSIYGGSIGVDISGAGTLTNGGSIIGGSFIGVYLGSGDITNGSATNTTALIDGMVAGTNVGIELDGSGTVANFGTIGGNVGYGAVLFGTGTITNNAGATLQGVQIGALLEGAGEVTNSGLIQATGDAGITPEAVFFEAGGTLTNTATGTISGASFGVAATGASLGVTNLGSIMSDIGVDLELGGTLKNGDATHTAATIEGGSYGVRIAGAAVSITNFGTISGQVGISLYSAGTAGSAFGTIANAGTIASTYGDTGTAVEFGTGTERLVVDKTGVFVGQVIGSTDTGASTTVEFASGFSGTLSALSGTGGTVTDASGSFSVQAITTLALDTGSSFKVADTGTITDLLLDGSLSTSGSLAVTTVEASSTGTADIAANATLDVTTDEAAGSAIDFTGASATLTIEDTSVFGTGVGTSAYTGPTIENFAPGETINLAHFASAGATITGFNAITGLLQLISGAAQATLKLAGSFAGEYFHVGPDAGSGTDVIVNGNPCYCRGTLIMTETGERPVESLAIGDQVFTWAGGVRPIRWIGRRGYTGDYAAAHPDILPILFRKNALAREIPRRDLLVSPRHAMYLNGFLVAARDLVNGTTILQVGAAKELEYFHVELDTHDVIFAEGAAAETFVDDCSRGMFHNAAEYDALYPEAPKLNSRPQWFAPLIEDGAELQAIRSAIAARAPISPAPSGQGGKLLGVLDVAEHARVAGWARNEDDPECPVVLRIRDNDRVVAEITANRYRPDLETTLGGTGRHGFDLLIPGGLSHFERHVIVVERVSDGAPLAGCPLVIEPATRFLRDLEADFGASLDALPAGPEQDRALKFLVRQTERLLQARAQVLGAAAEREAHRQLNRRWGKAALAEAAPRGPEKRALVIDDAWPDPARDAGSQAILSHIRALQSLGYQVSLVAAGQFYDADARTWHLEAAGISCCMAPWYGSVEEVLRRQAGCFDALYLHRIGNASKYLTLAREHQPAARIIYSVADLHHLRLARQAAIEGRPELIARGRHLRLQEFTAILSADATLTHSEAEAALIRREVHGARVIVAPWHVAVQDRPLPFEARTGVAFVAGFAHAPNVDAAHWFAEQIMPLVWRRNPAIEATIAGSAMPETVKRLACPGLSVLGQVPDLAPLYRGLRLAVAPLRYGAGIKGKVLEAFAHGLPCVMTDIAAEGIPLRPALLAAVSPNAEAIADAICRLHDDQAANAAAGEEARTLIADDFSETRVTDALQRAIEGRFAPANVVVPMTRGAAA